MKANSSTCLATFVYFSQTQAPHSPYCWNLKGDFISGPGLPLKTSIAIFLPSRLSSSGLGSNISTALGAPSMKSQITDLALAGKCGPALAAECLRLRLVGQERLAAQQVGQGQHAPCRRRHAREKCGDRRSARRGRTETGDGDAWSSSAANVPRQSTSVDIEELIEAEQGLAKVGQGGPADFLGRLVGARAPAAARCCASRKARATLIRLAAVGSRARAELEGALDQAARRHRFAAISRSAKSSRPSADKPVVEQRQGLRGDGRLIAAAARLLGIGPVERLQQRIGDDPLVEHIDAAAARGRRRRSTSAGIRRSSCCGRPSLRPQSAA